VCLLTRGRRSLGFGRLRSLGMLGRCAIWGWRLARVVVCRVMRGRRLLGFRRLRSLDMLGRCAIWAWRFGG
jgi:hypothetical protein